MTRTMTEAAPVLGRNDVGGRHAIAGARSAFTFVACVLSLLLLSEGTALAQSGTIRGHVVDAASGDGLPGAHVIVVGTALGVATDLDGAYRVSRVPAGTQTLEVRYLGYETARHEVEVLPGQTVEATIRLSYGTILGEEIQVLGQAAGQAAAINQQLASNTIVNIVSADRIQELPDQNAAESIGRLPGISIQRDAGEGQKVVVRGLSPRFNSITVNGERIPATDPDNRSVDLSMISPDVLAGIEVFKALTPDMDADAIGGTVNLVIRRAPDGIRGNARFESGYNAHAVELGQYRGNLSVSNRFLNDRLGMLATGGLQRANRSSHLLDGSYRFRREAREGEEHAIVEVSTLNLADRMETRERYNASLAIDFNLPNGDILYNTFWARTDRDELRRRKRYNVSNFRTEYEIRDRQINTYVFTQALSGRHDFGFANAEWAGSYSRSTRRMPFMHNARFQELAAFSADLIEDQGPEMIPLGAKNDLSVTYLLWAHRDADRVVDGDLTGSLNITVPVNIGNALGGYLKAGGKIRSKDRTRSITQHVTPFGAVDRIGQENAEFELYRNQHILISNFIDPGFAPRNFLEGRYEFGPGIDRRRMRAFYESYSDRYENNRIFVLENYTAGETVSAAYAMAELNLFRRLMLLPGFRYESTTNDYLGNFGRLREDLGRRGEIRDTTGGQTYHEFLPMIHARYRITNNVDIRGAVTRSLSRPDYFNLVPYERVVFYESFLERGAPDLLHTTAWNYDVFLSLYQNRLGLLTLGVFHKTVENIDYVRETRLTTGEFAGFAFRTPENAEESWVYGLEVDLQTQLRFLPSPLNGFILNANYSFAESETKIPHMVIGPRSTTPPFQPTVIDTFRVVTMPGQAKHIANLSLGYERGGFSGRISMIYQGAALRTLGTRSELDGFTNEHIRWDASLSQRVNRELMLFLNVNNITNQPERAYLGIARFATQEEYFGWTADLGVRYSF